MPLIPVSFSGEALLSVRISKAARDTFFCPAETVPAVAGLLPLTLEKVMLPGRYCVTTASKPSLGMPVVLTSLTVSEPSSAVDLTNLVSVSRVASSGALSSRPL